MPNFDDVVDMIDQAEEEVDNMIKNRQGNLSIGRFKGWNFGTARLSIQCPKYDGLTYHQLLAYLKGLRMSGFVYGFFEVQILFYDNTLTAHDRGTGLLEINQPR